ncbi:tetratricopeptide repeat protein [Elusimicrobiota bacterium]
MLDKISRPKSNQSYYIFEKVKQKQDMVSIIITLITIHSRAGIAAAFIGKFNKSLEIIERANKNYLPDPISYARVGIMIGRSTTHTYTGQHNAILKDMSEAKKIFGLYVKFPAEKEFWEIYCVHFVYWLVGQSYKGEKINEHYFKEGLSVAEEHDLFTMKAYLYHCVSLADCYAGRFNKLRDSSLINFHNLSVKMGQNDVDMVLIHLEWAQAYLERGELEEAEKYANQGLNIVERIDHVYAQSFIEIILGRIYFAKGKVKESIEILSSVIDICAKMNLEQIHVAQIYLSHIYLAAGDIQKAEELANKAHERVVEEIHENVYHQMLSYRLLGLIALNKKEYENSEELFNKSIAIANENDNIIQEGQTFLAKAKLYMELTHYTKAEEQTSMAEKLFRDIDNPALLKEVEILNAAIKEQHF